MKTSTLNTLFKTSHDNNIGIGVGVEIGVNSDIDASDLQLGQAMVETIIILLVVASVGVGIAWLSKIQDLALNNTNISSYAAFATSFNQNRDDILQNSNTLLSKQSQQWRNHDGSLMLKDSYQGLHLDWARSALSDDNIQIGMHNTHAKKLRKEWLSQDTGILNVSASLSPTNNEKDNTTRKAVDTPNENGLNNHDKNNANNQINNAYSKDLNTGLASSNNKLGLDFYLKNFPKITRHTSIATGAAYSYSDQDTVNHIKKSEYGWHGATNNSYRLGEKITDVASSVDGGWSRSKPIFDWLSPWQGLVPNHLKK